MLTNNDILNTLSRHKLLAHIREQDAALAEAQKTAAIFIRQWDKNDNDSWELTHEFVTALGNLRALAAQAAPAKDDRLAALLAKMRACVARGTGANVVEIERWIESVPKESK